MDDLIIMCGVIIALFTFINWKKRLFPFCNTSKARSAKNSPNVEAPRPNGSLVRFQRAVITRFGIIDVKEKKGGCLKIKNKLSGRKTSCDVILKESSRSGTALKENIEKAVNENSKRGQREVNL